MWYEVPVSVNGYSYVARYSDVAYEQVIVPLLKRMADAYNQLGRRTVVFLAGPPAAGKSTLALLLEKIAPSVIEQTVQAVGLDGFHCYNSYLRTRAITRDGEQIPLAAIKGAPETFDVAHFADKLQALRWRKTVLWPLYDRRIHDPVEDAIAVVAPIVIVEGNWLLLDELPWSELAPLADLTIFLAADEADVRERAVSRKAQGGISRSEAEEHYDRTDGPNIRRALGHSRKADITIRLTSKGDLEVYDSQS